MDKENNIADIMEAAGKEVECGNKIHMVFYGKGDDNGFYPEIVPCTFKDGVLTDVLGMSRKESEMTPGEVVMLKNGKMIADDGTITSTWSRFVKCVCENGVWRDEFGKTWNDDGTLHINKL